MCCCASDHPITTAGHCRSAPEPRRVASCGASGVMSRSCAAICPAIVRRFNSWSHIALLNGLLLLVVNSITQITVSNASQEVFTNSFLVRLRRDVDKHIAHQIAKRNGFVNLGAVSNDGNQQTTNDSNANHYSYWFSNHTLLCISIEGFYNSNDTLVIYSLLIFGIEFRRN